MIDRSPAQVLLEDIQRDIYKDRNIWLKEFQASNKAKIENLRQNPFSIFTDEDLVKLNQEDLDFYRKKMTSGLEYVETPTIYEDPVTYNIIMDLNKDLKKIADSHRLLQETDVQFGTLPLGPIDALHLSVPNSSQHLIIFESELFYLCNMISKVVVTACPITNITYKVNEDGKKVRSGINYSLELNKVEQQLNENPTILKHFREILLAFLIYGSVTKAPAYIVPEQYFKPWIQTRHGMELFVMGHEYGHVAQDHFKLKEFQKKLLGNHEVSEFTYNWSQEFVSDGIGADLMMQVMQDVYAVDRSLSYANAELFLQSRFIMRKALKMTKGKLMQGDNSHPSLKDRRNTLRMIMKKQYGEEFNIVFNFADKINSVLEFLWEKTESTFSDYYNAKLELTSSENEWLWI
jgi:hypothetical protein